MILKFTLHTSLQGKPVGGQVCNKSAWFQKLQVTPKEFLLKCSLMDVISSKISMILKLTIGTSCKGELKHKKRMLPILFALITAYKL